MSEEVVIRKLYSIQAESESIKKCMIDSDLIVTDDDLNSLKEADEDLSSGNTKRII